MRPRRCIGQKEAVMTCNDPLIAVEDEPIADPDVPAAFTVRDRASANWIVRKIAESRAYAEQVRAWADLELRRAAREEAFFLRRFGAELEAWARVEIESSRRKSLKLPAGTVSFRTEPIRLEVHDERKLILWCRRHLPDAVRVQTSVLRSAVKEHLMQTGECPDGAQPCGGGERFYIR
jgi:hypothetical protein